MMMSICGCKTIKVLRKRYKNRLPLISQEVFPISKPKLPNFTELSGRGEKL